MGAYLSSPITEKHSVDNTTEKYSYGASSMQGWRVSQEDAHNCCPDFDKESNTTLFAVYDGHGGEEVAKYCSLHLPDFIKTMPSYKEGHLPQALEDAFLGFDELLTKENVISELKQLAGMDPEEEANKEEEEEEEAMLYEEASIPLEDLIARYSGKPDAGRLNALRKCGKVQSPMIHAKKPVNGATDKQSPLSNSDNEAEIKTKLDDKFVNGHADNENNMNLEKEAKAAHTTQNDCTSSKAEIITEKLGQNHSNNNKDSDISSSDMKDSSTPAQESCSNSTELCDSVNQVSSDSGSNTVVSTTAGTPTAGDSSDVSTTSTVQAGQSGSSQPSAAVSTTVESSSEAGGSTAASVSTTVENSDDVDSSSKAESSKASSSSTSSKQEEEPEPCSSSSAGKADKMADEDDDDDDEDSLDEDDDEDELDSEDESEEDAWCPKGGAAEDEDEDCEDEEEDEDDEDGPVGMPCRDEKEEPGSDSGCTAVVALLKDKELHVANAGDSRCVVCRAGKALDMSVDHKPEDDLERNRIEKAGGKVTPDGRVNGGLNLSRAIGDHCYKKQEDLPLKDQMISALPDVKSISLTEEDEFMVLACDGIWNYMTSQEVVDFVKERIDKGQTKMSVICEEMFDHCLAPNTMGDGTGCDNMTGIIVNFKNLSSNGESVALKRKAEESLVDSTNDEPKRAKSQED